MHPADVYTLVEGTADAAFVVTPGGEICFWNQAAEQLFEYSASDVLNKSCDEVLRGTGSLGTLVCRHGCTVQCSAADTDSIPTFDLEVSTGSGKRLWVSVSTIVFEDSRLHRRLVMHLSRDISKRKETEKAFEQMLELSRQIIEIGESNPRLRPSTPCRATTAHSAAFLESKEFRTGREGVGYYVADAAQPPSRYQSKTPSA